MEKYPFGEEYRNASLSKLLLNREDIDNINKWLTHGRHIFFFGGNPGIGKTYLCAAIYNWLNDKVNYHRQRKEDNLSYTYYTRSFNQASLMDFLRTGISSGLSHSSELERICDTPYFLLDDLDKGRNDSEWQREVLFSFLDLRYSSGLPTVICSNLSTQKLGEYFGTRFMSRLEDERNLVMQMFEGTTDLRQNRRLLNDK